MSNRSRNRYSYSTSSSGSFIVLIVSIVIMLVICFGGAAIKVANPQTYVVTVQSKEVKNNDKSSKFMVFCLDPITGESHVFEVTDSLFKWRFDSADTYNIIREGETYEFTTGGYRIPFFSMYPNIYEVKKIDNPIKESKANG